MRERSAAADNLNGRGKAAAAQTQQPHGTAVALPYHPAFAGPVRFTSEPRPAGSDDEAATAQTVAAMYEYSTADSADAQVIAAAAEATARRGDQAQQVAGVFDWLRRNVQYVDDKELAFFRPVPEDAEVLIRPADLVRMRAPMGDCDEFAMMGRAMLRAVGITSQIKTIEAEKEAPGCYSHVYLIVHTTAGPIPFDAIPTGHGLGWEAEPTGKQRVWTADESDPMTRTLQITRMPAAARAFTRMANTRMRQQLILNLPAALVAKMQPNASTLGTLGDDGSDPGFDWGDFTTGLTDDAAKILGARYGVPQLNPGQVIRKADGTLLMQSAPGQPFNSSIFGGSTGSSSTLLIVVALGLGLLFVAKGN